MPWLPVEVVGAVLVRDDRVLAAQRGPTMALAGRWEFPGGKIEPGESPQKALVRELREELLCEVKVGDHVETNSHTYDFGVVRLATYFVTLVSGEPRATEHSQLRWIAVPDLRAIDWAPADLPAVEAVIRTLGRSQEP